MIRLLVLMHVLAGSIAVAGMLGALTMAKGGIWHRRCGRAYVWGMLVTLLLALVVSVLTGNVFLLLIGVFSSYFVFTGARLAKASRGQRSKLDQLSAQLMMIMAVLMLLYGGYVVVRGDGLGIALVVFSVIAFFPAWADYKCGDQWPLGKKRIVLHLNRMGGASIATITAVLVANVQTSPPVVAWLLPTLLGLPLIYYWSHRVLSPSHARKRSV